MPEWSKEASSRVIEANEWRIHYHDLGVPEGAPIVFLHNTGPGSTGWNNFAPCFKTLGGRHRLLPIDLPGWGKSSEASVSTGRDVVGSLLAFLDALDLETCVLVGNSRGGRVAMTFAALHGDRVSHLATAGSSVPGPNLFATGDRSDVSAAMRSAYAAPTVESLRRLAEVMIFDQSYVTDELTTDLLESALENPRHLENWLQLAERGSGGVGGPPDLLRRLGEISCPTLIVHGRNDRSIHFEHSLRLASIVENSRCLLMNGCGHWIPIERGPEFARQVDDLVRFG